MPGDQELVQIVDAALAEAVRKSGPWLVCRPGCWECCVGPFPITQLDAERLRNGLAALDSNDPERAVRLRERVRKAADRLPAFPAGLDEAEIEALPDEEPCPVLDPETGTCDLYDSRPLTCRLFGPPIRWGGEAVGVCELCFEGATDEQIAACEVPLDIGDREDQLLTTHQPTIVALALVSTTVRSPSST